VKGSWVVLSIRVDVMMPQTADVLCQMLSAVFSLCNPASWYELWEAVRKLTWLSAQQGSHWTSFSVEKKNDEYVMSASSQFWYTIFAGRMMELRRQLAFRESGLLVVPGKELMLPWHWTTQSQNGLGWKGPKESWSSYTPATGRATNLHI